MIRTVNYWPAERMADGNWGYPFALWVQGGKGGGFHPAGRGVFAMPDGLSYPTLDRRLRAAIKAAFNADRVKAVRP